MILRLSLYFAAFLLSISAHGQLSLTNPLICHDRDNYLRCYNDGNYIFTFSKGDFKEFRTSDNGIRYSETDKTITFIQKQIVYGSLTFDTIQIVQLPKSILLKKRTSSLEIISLKEIPKEIDDYSIGFYSIDNIVSGFTFWSGDRYIKLEVWTYGKTWSWVIIMKDNRRRFAIDYNIFRKNRFERLFIQDDSLRYGMGISMTFKTLKKISQLESSYVDTIKILENGTPVIGRIPLDKNYKYEYDKTGKLISKKTIGELKLCDCD